MRNSLCIPFMGIFLESTDSMKAPFRVYMRTWLVSPRPPRAVRPERVRPPFAGHGASSGNRPATAMQLLHDIARNVV